MFHKSVALCALLLTSCVLPVSRSFTFSETDGSTSGDTPNSIAADRDASADADSDACSTCPSAGWDSTSERDASGDTSKEAEHHADAAATFSTRTGPDAASPSATPVVAERDSGLARTNAAADADSPAPEPVAPPNPTAPCEDDCPQLLTLEGGDGFVCGLFEGGLTKCWGRDDRGQLGKASEGNHILSPADAEPIDFGTSRSVVQLATGTHHVCVRFDDGHARCWGANDSGQLGIGNKNDYSDQPMEPLSALEDLDLDNVVDMALGNDHTCLLRKVNAEATTVHCFGNNSSGQSGLGTEPNWGVKESVDASRPVDLGGRVPLSIHAGKNTTCARLESAGLQCWGNNVWTGRPAGSPSTLSPSTEEYTIIADLQLDEISAREAAWCARSGTNLLCWGYANNRMPFPTDNLELVREAVVEPIVLPLDLPGPIVFAYGSTSGCALSNDRAYCFPDRAAAGYGGHYDRTLDAPSNWDFLPLGGAVDVGDFDEQAGPDPIKRLFALTAVTCVETYDKELRCFGDNEWGQLGYGFAASDGSEWGNAIGHIGDDETPAEAYSAMGSAGVKLW